MLTETKRKNFLHFALPDFDDSEYLGIKEVLASGWITTGPKTLEFEKQFAAVVGCRQAIAVNSCTAAMHLSLEAIGLQPEDEVITTPYTFAATAEVIRYFQAKPVFVDINASDFNINVNKIESAITERTRAIIPVHIAGLAADLDAISAIAVKYNLAVIEDAAHAFPARYKDRMIGRSLPVDQGSNGKTVRKTAVCFSFYATKTISTAEGGMICTDDDALAERCRIMALHGISKDAWKRYAAEGSWFYEVIAPGYKYNLTDIAAAMGLAQLRKAERMWERRCEIAERYNEAFGAQPALQIPVDKPEYQHAWHLYMLRFNHGQLNTDRNEIIKELNAQNIGTSVHFIPLHIHPYYKKTFNYQALDFPVAFAEYQRVISLPVYSKMNDQDVDDVIENVLNIVKKYKTY